VTLNGQTYALETEQRAFDPDSLPGVPIKDDNGVALALVDHNCVVVVADITAADNEAGQKILGHVASEMVKHLDFDIAKLLKGERERMRQDVAAFRAAALKARIREKEEKLKQLHRDAEQAMYTLVDAERNRPILEAEVVQLQALPAKNYAVEWEVRRICELLESGVYEEIQCEEDGSLRARTGPITLSHDGRLFPLGGYEITIGQNGSVRISNLGKHPRAEHPHPHVGTDGRPCLGNIASDVAKMIGRCRIGDVLNLLHAFLLGYNPGNAYERIGRFDPSGEYQDEDENPCDNCDDSSTPFCIAECTTNDGFYGARDCCDYRTDYCYAECQYNGEGCLALSPCDECEHEGTAHCYLECSWNEEWQKFSPCEGCEVEASRYDSVDGAPTRREDSHRDETCPEDCPYLERRRSLENARSRTQAGNAVPSPAAAS